MYLMNRIINCCSLKINMFVWICEDVFVCLRLCKCHVGLLVYTCVNARVHVWMGDSVHELEYIRLCVCVCGCVSWCLFCAPLLMHRHSRDVRANGSWSCRGCIDCSDLQIIALKSDQQQPTKVKNFSNQQEYGCSTPRSNMFNCLWCSPAPTAEGPGGGRQVQGLTFPFHSQPHSHIDWEMYQCSSLQHCSNYQTQTKLEALSTGIGTLYSLETIWSSTEFYKSEIHSEWGTL